MMNAQRKVVDLGGTMRLGTYPCKLLEGSRARQIYETDEIQERHRHRFEVNPAYHEAMRAAGMSISGVSPDGTLVEMIEIPSHPYYVACQFHPEFKSRPLAAHPLFSAFIRAAIDRQLRLGRDSGLSGQTAIA
jgi:CTP synthase